MFIARAFNTADRVTQVNILNFGTEIGILSRKQKNEKFRHFSKIFFSVLIPIRWKNIHP